LRAKSTTQLPTPITFGEFDMTVSAEERAAMARLMAIMNGESPAAASRMVSESRSSEPVQLLGAGQVSQRDVNAMADVLRKLESAVNNTSNHMLAESHSDPQLREALQTSSVKDGVKIGIYRIQQQLDESRVAGKQYYNVINSITGDTVAAELSLYEAAHGLVRLLNNGRFFNSDEVRKLMEAESAYTSHKIDAVRFHRMARKAERAGLNDKAELMEVRKQASLDKAMTAKSMVKKIYNNQI
jgi:hypothetical protein